MTTELASRYQQIMRRVAALSEGRANAVLVAVTKTLPVEPIQALYSLGHRDFGENYVQELIGKAGALREQGYADIRWHFIGHLQTNKVKALVPFVYAIHTVESERLAAEIARRWGQGHSKPLPCFIEVNIDREGTKSGVMPEAAPGLAAALAARFPQLDLRGLMAIPSTRKDAQQAPRAFAELRELEQKCRPHTHGQLSMGMSGDYEIALSQGATAVRVGTALFGPRNSA